MVVLSAILNAVSDPNPAVRQGAYATLGEVAVECQPQVCDFHESILPKLISGLSDASKTFSRSREKCFRFCVFSFRVSCHVL